MSCNYNPQGFATAGNPAAMAPYQQSNSTYAARSAPEGDTGYTEINQWGETINVNPNNPTSPLSVQPGGRGTPFVTNGATTLPGEINTGITTLPGNVGSGVSTLPGEINTGISLLPETLTQHIYTPGYLTEYIGRLMRVEFLIGSQTTDRVGYLREVGASYIVLESVDYGNLMMCDLYSIKFATILQNPIESRVAALYDDVNQTYTLQPRFSPLKTGAFYCAVDKVPSAEYYSTSNLLN